MKGMPGRRPEKRNREAYQPPTSKDQAIDASQPIAIGGAIADSIEWQPYINQNQSRTRTHLEVYSQKQQAQYGVLPSQDST